MAQRHDPFNPGFRGGWFRRCGRDDPVQSLDDVHIAQSAALLRTLSKGMTRQVVLAVHERALFDYPTLELSPAFTGDSLIAVEITRNFEGDAVATPRAFSFEADRAIAA